MPIALDPSETCPVILELDKAKTGPDELKPTFLARFLSRRDVRKVKEMITVAVDETDEAKSEALLDQCLAFQYVGWRNLRTPDGAEVAYTSPTATDSAWDLVLTLVEKWELARAAVRATIEVEMEKKSKLQSPALSAGGISAPNAVASSVATNRMTRVALTESTSPASPAEGAGV